jgi:hypothetical protein
MFVLISDVPREVLTGTVILTFTPAASRGDEAVKKKMTEAEEMEYIRLHAEELNREAMDVLSYQSLNPEYDFDL